MYTRAARASSVNGLASSFHTAGVFSTIRMAYACETACSDTGADSASAAGSSSANEDTLAGTPALDYLRGAERTHKITKLMAIVMTMPRAIRRSEL